MNKHKKLIFIVNPQAQNGLSLRIWHKLEKKLTGIAYEVFYTAKAGDGQTIANQVAMTKEEMLIVAVGGDGTIHEVINGAIHFSHVTFAFIAAGSGNDFARGYQVPTNPIKGIKTIIALLHQKGSAYDAGSYQITRDQKGFFINSLGVGFDASIAHKASRSRLKKWLNYIKLGQAIYVFYLLAEIFIYKPQSVDMVVDGIKHSYEKVWFITMSNQPFYGGGMKIAPEAHPQNGNLSIHVIHRISRLKILVVFITVFWGGHVKFKEVESLTGKEIYIQFHQQVPIHADGESVGTTPIQVKIVPQCWRFIF